MNQLHRVCGVIFLGLTIILVVVGGSVLLRGHGKKTTISITPRLFYVLGFPVKDATLRRSDGSHAGKLDRAVLLGLDEIQQDAAEYEVFTPEGETVFVRREEIAFSVGSSELLAEQVLRLNDVIRRWGNETDMESVAAKWDGSETIMAVTVRLKRHCIVRTRFTVNTGVISPVWQDIDRHRY